MKTARKPCSKNLAQIFAVVRPDAEQLVRHLAEAHHLAKRIYENGSVQQYMKVYGAEDGCELSILIADVIEVVEQTHVMANQITGSMAPPLMNVEVPGLRPLWFR